MSSNDDKILTIDEVKAYLKIPKSTVYKLAQEGRIPAQKVGRQWRFHRDAIDGWIKRDGRTDDATRSETP